MKFEKAKNHLKLRNIKLIALNGGRATMVCGACNHEWTTDLHGVLYGKKRGCPHCAKVARIKRITVHRKTNDEVDHLLLKHNIPITRVGDYVNSHTKIVVMCDICQHEWKNQYPILSTTDTAALAALNENE